MPLALADLSQVLGDHTGKKQLLGCALKVVREQVDDRRIAQVLRELSDTNRMLGLFEEGIQQAREALEIYQRLGIALGQALCLNYLARLLLGDKQLDAAKEAASQAIDLAPGKGQEFLTCDSHRFLGEIYRSKGEREMLKY